MREIISLVSVDCGHRNTYWTRKNKKKCPDRMERKKFCPACGNYVLHREKK